MLASATPKSSIEVLGRRQRRFVDAGHLGRPFAHQADEVVAVHRRLVDARRAGDLGGADADPVHLDVVGMAVAAVVVVDGEHVGVLFVQDAGEALRGFVDVGARERSRCVVRRLAGHAGVE